MSVGVAAGAATVLASIALVAVLVSFPLIQSELNDIRATLDREMDQWKVTTCAR